MPASLFAAWAGRRATEYRVTSATPVTSRAKRNCSAALTATVTVSGARHSSNVGGITDPKCSAITVTPVAEVLWTRLPAKRPTNQASSLSNPGSPGNTTLSAGLDRNDPTAWHMLFGMRVAYRQMSAVRTTGEAEVLAFADCLLKWHSHHGAKQDPEHCAGCGERFSDNDALDLGRGARVHLDPRLSCLTRYGQAWRGAAVAGLHALGVEPPAGFELL